MKKLWSKQNGAAKVEGAAKIRKLRFFFFFCNFLKNIFKDKFFFLHFKEQIFFKIYYYYY